MQELTAKIQMQGLSCLVWEMCMLRQKRRYEHSNLAVDEVETETDICSDDDFDPEWELTDEERRFLFLDVTKEEFLQILTML
jgi:hypothetical protein